MANTLQIYVHDQKKKTVQIRYQHNVYRTGFKSLGESGIHLLSKLYIEILAQVGPSGDPISTPPTCL